MNLIIVGSGALAAELTSYIEDQNKHVAEEDQLNLLGYLDAEENIEKYWSKYNFKKPVLGDVYSYDVNKDDYFIIGISHIGFRTKMIDVLENKGARIIGFTHHSAIIADSALVDAGTIIYPYCIIGPNCVIGKHNVMTAYTCISHDCIIGNSNFFSTTVLGGRVTVGENNYFGIRSTVIPKLSIGSNNIIQAGMVVDKNIEDDSIVFHRFKEKVIAVPKN